MNRNEADFQQILEQLERMHRALAALRENGEFARLQARWFPAPASP